MHNEHFYHGHYGDRGDRGKKRSGGAKAFTLVELLVVMSILAILASILMPSLSHIQIVVKEKQTFTRFRVIGIALNMYADEFNKAYPPSTGMGNLTGSQMLVVFLVGYADDDGDGVADNYATMPNDDGVDGFGWRVISKTRPHGPYASTEDLQMWKKEDGLPYSPLNFSDAFNTPIHYYSYTVSGSGPDGYQRPHNNDPDNVAPAYVGLPGNGGRTALAAYRRDFILMSRGYNGVWDDGEDTFDGNAPTEESLWNEEGDPPGPKKGCDDLTNFLSND